MNNQTKQNKKVTYKIKVKGYNFNLQLKFQNQLITSFKIFKVLDTKVDLEI